jgi:hypothetical protein
MEDETNSKAVEVDVLGLITPGVLSDVVMVTRWRTPGASVEQQTRESRIGRAIMALLLAHLYVNETERRDALRRALQIVAALSADGEP